MLGKSSMFVQAEDLLHFSYDASNEKFLLVVLQGVDYILHNPEIAAIEILIEARPAEELFYTGNHREKAINNFFTAHKRNLFPPELDMAEIKFIKSEEDET